MHHRHAPLVEQDPRPAENSLNDDQHQGDPSGFHQPRWPPRLHDRRQQQNRRQAHQRAQQAMAVFNKDVPGAEEPGL